MLIEASEESGSPDLPAYVDALADRIGTPSLVICLDSGCIDYERLWVTTSLRGLVSGTLTVDIVTAGLHSGDVRRHGARRRSASPACSSIASKMRRPGDDPAARTERRRSRPIAVDEAADDRGRDRPRSATDYPFVDGAAHRSTDDPAEQLLARTWPPS